MHVYILWLYLYTDVGFSGRCLQVSVSSGSIKLLKAPILSVCECVCVCVCVSVWVCVCTRVNGTFCNKSGTSKGLFESCGMVSPRSICSLTISPFIVQRRGRSLTAGARTRGHRDLGSNGWKIKPMRNKVADWNVLNAFSYWSNSTVQLKNKPAKQLNVLNIKGSSCGKYILFYFQAEKAALNVFSLFSRVFCLKAD